MALAGGPYYTDNDVTFPDVSTTTNVCKSFLLRTKQLMAGQIAGTNGPDGAPPVGSRWTVISSSNSVTSGASDNWTTIADLVRAAAGVAHSWVVLQSPAAIGSYQICIDWASAADADYILAYSKVGFTGGTTTNRPTATDEVASVVAQTKIGLTTATATHRLSRVTDADGNFHIYHITAGSSTGFHSLFGVKKLVGADSSDLYQVGFFYEHLASGRGVGGTAGAFPLYTFSASAAGGWFQRSTDGVTGTPDSARGSGISLPNFGSGITHTYLSSTAADSATGKYYGRGCSVWTSHSAGARVAERGYIVDFNIGNAGPAVGTVEPGTGTPERVVIGNWWMPCGGIAPLM